MTYHRTIFSSDIRLKLKQSVELKDLYFSSRGRLIKIDPRDGFIIEVEGKGKSMVGITIESIEEMDGIKVVELTPEKKEIKLDKRGRGVFKIGALIVVNKFLRPGKHLSEIKFRVKYLD